jgi:predicted transposase/invertase (TIGR01784 family)
MIQNDVLSTAKLEGLTEGRSKGRAEGREEALLSTARNLKAMGLSMEDISRATGLSKEDILKL